MTWCGYAGAKNEPKDCGGVVGHFCRDIYGKSGFSPCDEAVAPTWGHFQCEGPPSPPPAQAPAAAFAPAEADAAAEAAAPTAEQEQAARAEWSAASNGVKDGADCYLVCGQTAGACDDFCGMPGLWSGMCCKSGAAGGEAAPECDGKGCIGFHCCVSAPLSPQVPMSSARTSARIAPPGVAAPLS